MPFAHDNVAGLYLCDGYMCHVVVTCSGDGSDVGLRLCRTEATGIRGGDGASVCLSDNSIGYGRTGAGACACGGGRFPTAERRVSNSWR